MKKSIFTLFLLAFFSLSIFGQENHISLAKVKKGKKYGYVDGEANLIIPVEYDKLGEFNEGLVTGQKNEEWFILDIKGNIISKLGTRYKYLGQFGSGLCFATNSVSHNDQEPFVQIGDDDIRFINRKGEEVFILHDSIPRVIPHFNGFRFHNGFLKVEKLNEQTNTSFYGYVNATGKLVIPQIFHVESIGNYGGFHEGLALTPSRKHNPYFNGENPQEYGFIDTTGKWIIPPAFPYGHHFENGVAQVDSTVYHLSPFGDTTQGYISHLINKDGKKIFPYDVFIQNSTNNYVITYKKEKGKQKYALARTNGTYVTDFIYDGIIAPSRGGHFIAQKDTTTGTLTKEGKWLQPIEESYYERYDYSIGTLRKHNFNDGYYIMCFIDLEGNVILPFKKRDNTIIEGGVIKEVISGNPWEQNEIHAYYNRKGKLLDLSEYDEIHTFQWIFVE